MMWATSAAVGPQMFMTHGTKIAFHSRPSPSGRLWKGSLPKRHRQPPRRRGATTNRNSRYSKSWGVSSEVVYTTHQESPHGDDVEELAELVGAGAHDHDDRAGEVVPSSHADTGRGLGKGRGFGLMALAAWHRAPDLAPLSQAPFDGT